jgi:hypothetical protein
MDFQIVVMRYMEDVSWVENLENVIIYNKGNQIQTKHKVVNLPNIGMYHASQFYHCVVNYENLADKTLFIQANPFDGDLETRLGITNTEESVKKMIDYYKYIPDGLVSSNPPFTHILHNRYEQPFNWNQRHHDIFIKYTHTWQDFLDELIDPKRLINWRLPTLFFRNGHIALKKEAILSNPVEYYIKLLEYWKYDVPCAEWLAESILGLFFNVGNNRKLINLHHDIIDYSKLDDYKKWAYEIE